MENSKKVEEMGNRIARFVQSSIGKNLAKLSLNLMFSDFPPITYARVYCFDFETKAKKV
jgi:hypothetical protein